MDLIPVLSDADVQLLFERLVAASAATAAAAASSPIQKQSR